MKKIYYSICLIRLTLIEKNLKKLQLTKKSLLKKLTDYNYSIVYKDDDIRYSK